MKLLTNWTEPTRNPFKAFFNLCNALKTGEDYFIAYIDNKKCDIPIKITNPKLDNPFNWTMLYGTITEQIEERFFTNETEKMLFHEYTVFYSEEKARDEYIKSGKITKGLGKGMGICTPVKISDANKWRAKYVKDGYKYIPKTHAFKPLDNISYWVDNPKIKKVFVVAKYDVKPHLFKSKKISWQKVLLKTWLFITYPLRFIPEYSILKMDKYTNHSFRIGSVVNGYELEVQIPKKFSFSG